MKDQDLVSQMDHFVSKGVRETLVETALIGWEKGVLVLLRLVGLVTSH